ncbi:MAG TPA: hypothetical protein VKM55_13760 [Candidatus Lokiarchaeia archaeon]|nr:hypothetical protein [Candidatus Lokiarchaeia archaeon]
MKTIKNILNGLTIPDLITVCKNYGLHGYSNQVKDDIIALIVENVKNPHVKESIKAIIPANGTTALILKFISDHDNELSYLRLKEYLLQYRTLSTFRGNFNKMIENRVLFEIKGDNDSTVLIPKEFTDLVTRIIDANVEPEEIKAISSLKGSSRDFGLPLTPTCNGCSYVDKSWIQKKIQESPGMRDYPGCNLYKTYNGYDWVCNHFTIESVSKEPLVEKRKEKQVNLEDFTIAAVASGVVASQKSLDMDANESLINEIQDTATLNILRHTLDKLQIPYLVKDISSWNNAKSFLRDLSMDQLETVYKSVFLIPSFSAFGTLANLTEALETQGFDFKKKDIRTWTLASEYLEAYSCDDLARLYKEMMIVAVLKYAEKFGDLGTLEAIFSEEFKNPMILPSIQDARIQLANLSLDELTLARNEMEDRWLDHMLEAEPIEEESEEESKEESQVTEGSSTEDVIEPISDISEDSQGLARTSNIKEQIDEIINLTLSHKALIKNIQHESTCVMHLIWAIQQAYPDYINEVQIPGSDDIADIVLPSIDLAIEAKFISKLKLGGVSNAKARQIEKLGRGACLSYLSKYKYALLIIFSDSTDYIRSVAHLDVHQDRNIFVRGIDWNKLVD